VNDALVQALVVGVFALSCGVLVLAWARERLALGAAILFSVALVVWVIDFVAILSGFGDADSFVVCTEDCTGLHYSVVVGFLAPPLLIALAAGAGIVVVEQRRRTRRAQ
jgi:hypothetical protein